MYATLHSFSKRQNESSGVFIKYPDRIPIIIEKNPSNKSLPEIAQKKYLVPKDLSVNHLIYIVRGKINLTSSDAIFLYTKDTLHKSSSLIGTIYEEHKNDDGFLYMLYTSENTFG